jgi:hypothetical protein
MESSRLSLFHGSLQLPSARTLPLKCMYVCVYGFVRETNTEKTLSAKVIKGHREAKATGTATQIVHERVKKKKKQQRQWQRSPIVFLPSLVSPTKKK